MTIRLQAMASPFHTLCIQGRREINRLARNAASNASSGYSPNIKNMPRPFHPLSAEADSGVQHNKGLLFHSAMVVDRVEVLPAEDAMRLVVTMALTRPGASGAFEVDVPLSGEIKSVVFGADRTPVWRRTAGKRQQEATA